MKRWIAAGLFGIALAACQGEPEPVTVMLDWVPNTNHTGLFVAQAMGYFEDEELEVEIIQPGEVFAEQAVVGGSATFGVSFQEQVTLARADDIPIVSIAAIIQHNTSAFASRAEVDAGSPQDWESLTYGSFGSPFEEPTLRLLMECDDGNAEELEIVDVGFSDPLALLSEGEIDLAWIFTAWQGIQAEQQGLELNVIPMDQWFDCVPDYYTPVLITSERTLSERPETVSAFLRAVSRGYQLSIDDPERAAQVLLAEVPELDPELVVSSQAWLAPRYQAEAPRWGEQSFETWDGYSRWMAENGIIEAPIDSAAAFTNELLP